MRDYETIKGLLRGIAAGFRAKGNVHASKTCDDAADAIEELLAAVPKNGKWIAERDGSIVELDEDGYVTDSCHCSVCNEHLDGSEEYAVKGNYCPSCGAKMEVSEDAD